MQVYKKCRYIKSVGQAECRLYTKSVVVHKKCRLYTKSVCWLSTILDIHIIYDLNNHKCRLYTKSVVYKKCRLYTKSVGYTQKMYVDNQPY